MDEFCGVDKWYDNHFAWDNVAKQNAIPLDTFKANLDKTGVVYHIFGDCKPQKIGPGTNIYLVDPTGDAVQINGAWDHCPHGGSGDALQNACSQGNCKKYHASVSCSKALASHCESSRLQNNTCTDCAYLQWRSLKVAGCRNADLVNF